MLQSYLIPVSGSSLVTLLQVLIEVKSLPPVGMCANK